MKLLDVNVWLAALWARHTDHDTARRWMDDADDELAFCRLTEMGLLRHLTNPAIVGPDARSRRNAWDIVLALQADPRVRFLQEPAGLAPLWMTYSKRDDRSHLLWTDDYLAAFAQAGQLELVTLDRRFADRYPAVRTEMLR
jgi:toxin-antitoxin system PIN domain toxin